VKDFEKVVTDINNSQKNYYIVSFLGISTLLILWIMQIAINLNQVKSDRLPQKTEPATALIK
jgi:hypothetical protein